MKAELLYLPADVTDLERAEGVADRLDDLLLDIAWIFPRTDLWGRAAACGRDAALTLVPPPPGPHLAA